MVLIGHEVPNLIAGVSQQPAAARFASQLDVMENAYPSVVEGLIKRPPTRHLGELLSSSVGNRKVHAINRDAQEQYVVLVGEGELRVFGLDGTEFQVHQPGGGSPTLTYLTSASDPKNEIKALTIADYTFLLNTTQKVELSSTLSPDFNDLHLNSSYGFVYVRQAAYETNYKVICYFNNGGAFPTGEYYVEYTTGPSGVEDAKHIANQLATLMNGANWTKTGGASGLSIPDVNATHVGSIIRINCSHTGVNTIASMDYVQTEDGVGNTGMTAFYRNVSRYVDLPLVCYQGELFEVKGDADVVQDNYWIKFVPDDVTKPFGEGHWEETVEPDVKFQLDNTTMPHQLIRKQDDGAGSITGTPNAIYFEYAPADWSDKAAGDTESNPQPTFVSTATEDRFIEDLVLHKGRLGFLSGENIILSGSGDFFNFWRTTVLQLLDSDPIDVGASHTKVAIQRHALGFNERLISFSDRTQFVTDGVPILTPATVSITPVTEFESSPEAAPVSTGRGIYFATKRGDFSGLREMFQLGDSLIFDSSDVTAQVPQYIQGTVRQISASSLLDVVVVRADGEDAKNTLYVYKYYWQGQQKAQSAWGKWTFGEDTELLDASFFEDRLLLTLKRGSALFLEDLEMGDILADPDAPIVTHLDRRVSENECVTTYNASTDVSRITLPYSTNSASVYRLVSRWTPTAEGGREFPILAVGTNWIEVQGDFSSGAIPFFVGAQYTKRARLAAPLLREESGRGGSTSPVSSGKQSVRYGIVELADTRTFKVRVLADQRAAREVEFSAPAVGAAAVDGFELADGSFRFPVLARPQEVSVEFVNDSPWPSKLSSVEWQSQYASRVRRS